MRQSSQDTISCLADKIIKNKLSVPSVFFLELVKPLSFIGSQLLHFCSPVLSPFFKPGQLEQWADTFESREDIEHLILEIENREATND